MSEHLKLANQLSLLQIVAIIVGIQLAMDSKQLKHAEQQLLDLYPAYQLLTAKTNSLTDIQVYDEVGNDAEQMQEWHADLESISGEENLLDWLLSRPVENYYGELSLPGGRTVDFDHIQCDEDQTESDTCSDYQELVDQFNDGVSLGEEGDFEVSAFEYGYNYGEPNRHVLFSNGYPINLGDVNVPLMRTTVFIEGQFLDPQDENDLRSQLHLIAGSVGVVAGSAEDAFKNTLERSASYAITVPGLGITVKASQAFVGLGMVALAIAFMISSHLRGAARTEPDTYQPLFHQVANHADSLFEVYLTKTERVVGWLTYLVCMSAPVGLSVLALLVADQNWIPISAVGIVSLVLLLASIGTTYRVCFRSLDLEN